jgi:hypothetical protein
MTNHTGHGHPATPAARAACRKFMVDHDGMDEVTYRVSVREAELDDAFEDEGAEYAELVKAYREARAHLATFPTIVNRRNAKYYAAFKVMTNAARALRDAGLDPADWDN